MANVFGKWIELFVPGRVCLLGEHSDWAGMHRTPEHPEVSPGRCLAYGTPFGIYSRAGLFLEDLDINSPPVVFHMRSVKTNGSHEKTMCPLNLDCVKKNALDGGFFSYVYGTITILLERYKDSIYNRIEVFCGEIFASRRVDVIIDNYLTDLPIGKGLSSSAAVCVTVARCFSSLFDLNMDTEEIMDVAFCGEILTGSQCGRLDQCVAFGQSCVDLHFEGAEVRASKVHLPPGVVVYFVVADLNSSKDTKKILHELGDCFDHHGHDPVKSGVREFLGPVSLSLVEQATDAMRRGDLEALGTAFTEYQRLFDKAMMPACTELLAPRLHEVLNDPEVKQYSCGGKGVGSQGDGSVQLVCRSKIDQMNLVRILEEKLNCHPLPLFLKG